MAAVKFLLDDDLGYDFDLIARHASLEPYYLAFLLNKTLGFGFERCKEDLVLFYDKTAAPFARYDYHDRGQDIDYYLMANKVKIEQHTAGEGLFNDQKSIGTAHFIADKPQVDYFIKVREDGYAFAKAKTKFLKTLNQIPQIVTAYTLSVDQLKTKQNLIFE